MVTISHVKLVKMTEMKYDRKARTQRAILARSSFFNEVTSDYYKCISSLRTDWMAGLLLCSLRRSEKRFRRDVFAMSMINESALTLALSQIALSIRYLAAQTGWGGKSMLGDAYRVFLDSVMDIASLLLDGRDADTMETVCTEVFDIKDAVALDLPMDILQPSIEDWFSRRWEDFYGYTDFDISIGFGCNIDAARRCCMALKAKGKIVAMTIPYYVPLFQHCDAPCPPIKISETTRNAIALCGILDDNMWEALEHIERVAIEMDNIQTV